MSRICCRFGGDGGDEQSEGQMTTEEMRTHTGFTRSPSFLEAVLKSAKGGIDVINEPYIRKQKAENEALHHMREAAKWLAWGDGVGPDPRQVQEAASGTEASHD